MTNLVMILAATTPTAGATSGISGLISSGVTDVMKWAQWLIYAVGAIMIITSVIFFFQHFKNHGKGQSKLVPAIALLILGAMAIVGGGAFSSIGNAGKDTLNNWAENKTDNSGGPSHANPFNDNNSSSSTSP